MPEHLWWQRTVLVLRAPQAVFRALRTGEGKDEAERAEPVLLIVILAGVALMLATPTAGRLMNTHEFDSVLTFVWIFLGGIINGTIAYWVFGLLLHVSLRTLGSQGNALRSRNILAFASVPLALFLGVWLVKLGAFGAALFHRGGADAGTAGEVFRVIWLGFVAWAAALLVVGIRSVHVWSWPRSALAAVPVVALAAALPLY